MKSYVRVLLAIVLCFAFCVSAVAMPLCADVQDTAVQTEQNADGECLDDALLDASVVLSGEGTKESPYLISNESDLNLFASNVNLGVGNDAYYKLTASIDLGGEKLTAIGTKENAFKGVFDGNGYTLNNFVMTGTEYIGIFGYVDGADIKNLFVGDFTVDLTQTSVEKVYVGAVSYALNSTISKLCVNCESVSLTGQTKYVYAAAVCGYGESNAKGKTLVEDCYSLCDITLVNQKGYGYMGGIVGRFATSSGGNALVNRCYNVGNISVTSYNSANVGGLVGYLYSHGSAYSPELGSLSADTDVMISNSFAVASVYAKSSAYSSRAGKIVGNVNTYATCDTATTLYTTDKSVTVTGTARTMGTGVVIGNLQSQSYLASKIGLDFVNTWELNTQSSYKYPTFKSRQLSYDGDECLNFFAVSTDYTLNSGGNIIELGKVRLAGDHKLTLDRGTYIIDEIVGNANNIIVPDMYTVIIIGGENKPSGYVEFEAPYEDIQSNYCRFYCEIDGNQYEIDDVYAYGFIANEETIIEIAVVEYDDSTYSNATASHSYYYHVNPETNTATRLSLDSFVSTDKTPEMRFVEPMGARFKSTISTLAKLENEQFKITEYGYIITLEDYLTESNAQLNFDFSLYVCGTAYDSRKGKDIIFDDTNDEYHVFTGVLCDIPSSRYRERFVAKTYTKIEIGEKEFVVYGEQVCDSLYDMANANINNEGLSDEQKQALDSIINAIPAV